MRIALAREVRLGLVEQRLGDAAAAAAGHDGDVVDVRPPPVEGRHDRADERALLLGHEHDRAPGW